MPSHTTWITHWTTIIKSLDAHSIFLNYGEGSKYSTGIRHISKKILNFVRKQKLIGNNYHEDEKDYI